MSWTPKFNQADWRVIAQRSRESIVRTITGCLLSLGDLIEDLTRALDEINAGNREAAKEFLRMSPKAIDELRELVDLIYVWCGEHALDQKPSPERPHIVCLCGSTRFWREFQRAALRETLAGQIVLSIGAASGTDDEHFGNLPRDQYEQVKARLDELHLRKIDLADEVLILNVGGYIGDSTARELEYARAHGKEVRFLEKPGGVTDGSRVA